MILLGGKYYKETAPVDWETAQILGGFYFARARHLGLPNPPAIAVADPTDLTPYELEIIGGYHRKYQDAETEQAGGQRYEMDD